MHQYNHAVAAIVAGYVLVIAALLLNLVTGNKLGVICALLSVAMAYIHECYQLARHQVSLHLSFACVSFCVLSLLLWLFM